MLLHAKFTHSQTLFVLFDLVYCLTNCLKFALETVCKKCLPSLSSSSVFDVSFWGGTECFSFGNRDLKISLSFKGQRLLVLTATFVTANNLIIGNSIILFANFPLIFETFCGA